MSIFPYRDRWFWRTAAVAVSLRVLAIYLLLLTFQDTEWIRHMQVDIWGWSEFLRRSGIGQIPYVDYTKEYPVGAGLIYWLLGQITDGRDAKTLLIVHTFLSSWFEVCNVLLVYGIVKRWRPFQAHWYAIAYALLPTSLILGPFRFESAVTLCVLLGYHWLRSNREVAAIVSWSIGGAVKMYPIVFMAAEEVRIFFGEKRYFHWIKTALIFCLVTAAINLPFIMLGYYLNGHIHDWIHTYKFHVDRPLYWDTLLGVWGLWTGPYTWERYASLWTIVLMAIVLLMKPRLSLLRKGSALCITSVLVNRVYSTQFNLWFYPFIVIGISRLKDRRERIGAFTWLALLDLLNIAVYPFLFSETSSELHGFGFGYAAERGSTWTILFSTAIVIRTVVLLIGLYGLLFYHPKEKETS